MAAPDRAHGIRSDQGVERAVNSKFFALVTLTHQHEVNVFEALERYCLKEEFNAATVGQCAVIQHHRGSGWDACRLTDQRGTLVSFRSEVGAVMDDDDRSRWSISTGEDRCDLIVDGNDCGCSPDEVAFVRPEEEARDLREAKHGPRL